MSLLTFSWKISFFLFNNIKSVYAVSRKVTLSEHIYTDAISWYRSRWPWAIKRNWKKEEHKTKPILGFYPNLEGFEVGPNFLRVGTVRKCFLSGIFNFQQTTTDYLIISIEIYFEYFRLLSLNLANLFFSSSFLSAACLNSFNSYSFLIPPFPVLASIVVSLGPLDNLGNEDKEIRKILLVRIEIWNIF